MNYISRLGITLGIVITTLSIVRWFFIYYDLSQMALGVLLGLIVCGFAYIYNWMRIQGEINNKFEKRLDSFVKWMGKNEIK